jgi:hypothetical membrane protein
LSRLNLQYKALLRVTGVYGVIAPVIAFVCIFVATASYPQFSWTSNALSDLGVVPGVTAGVFNSGLVICGVMSLTFALGLHLFMNESWAGRAGVIFFAFACLALVAIGVFPESVSPIHYWVSVAFFVTLPVSLLIFVGEFWRTHESLMAIFTLLVAVSAATPWVLLFIFHYVSGVAIPEVISGLAGAFWTVVFGIKMYRAAAQSKATRCFVKKLCCGLLRSASKHRIAVDLSAAKR